VVPDAFLCCLSLRLCVCPSVQPVKNTARAIPKSLVLGTGLNKYKRYYGPGRLLLCLLTLYMPMVSPACCLCINIHQYAPLRIGSRCCRGHCATRTATRDVVSAISLVCVDGFYIFSKLSSVVHLRTQVNCFEFNKKYDFRGLLLRHVRYALMNFLKKLVDSASWDKDELIKFWVQKVKGQGHQAEAYRA